jgi:hypothetical protein
MNKHYISLIFTVALLSNCTFRKDVQVDLETYDKITKTDTAHYLKIIFKNNSGNKIYINDFNDSKSVEFYNDKSENITERVLTEEPMIATSKWQYPDSLMHFLLDSNYQKKNKVLPAFIDFSHLYKKDSVTIAKFYKFAKIVGELEYKRLKVLNPNIADDTLVKKIILNSGKDRCQMMILLEPKDTFSITSRMLFFYKYPGKYKIVVNNYEEIYPDIVNRVIYKQRTMYWVDTLLIIKAFSKPLEEVDGYKLYKGKISSEPLYLDTRNK